MFDDGTAIVYFVVIDDSGANIVRAVAILASKLAKPSDVDICRTPGFDVSLALITRQG